MTEQLTLPQVDFPPPGEDELKNTTGKDALGSVRLKSKLDKISVHWPAPPNPNHLHVIVELPGETLLNELGECIIRLLALDQDILRIRDLSCVFTFASNT